MSRLVVIIQCDTVQQRCCGYNCTHAFYSREGKFADYDADTHYMSFTCGGCCGGALTVKLENLRKRLRRFQETDQEIIIHLSTCMVSDNSHKPPCPHLDYIMTLLSAVQANERGSGYTIEFADNEVVSGKYEIPLMTYRKRGAK